MELKQIKELMTAMEKAGMKRVRLKDKNGYELELERKDDSPASPHPAPSFYSHAEPHAKFSMHAPMPTHHHSSSESAEQEKKLPDGKYIPSPMVGTLYLTPSPEDPPFVKVGDRVEENTVVCIIEAMKVMNEVKAGMSGTVAEILLENGHPVEFGAKVFRIV